MAVHNTNEPTILSHFFSASACVSGRAPEVVLVAELLHQRSETHVVAQLRVHVWEALAMCFSASAYAALDWPNDA